MVIGTYLMTDFHTERNTPPVSLTTKSGHRKMDKNNALRINGLGAPRAFYTPILREYQSPEHQLWRRLCPWIENLTRVSDRHVSTM